eukprot:GHVL01001906.1.p1 GENE.GHVL01001906.1~~GHVL01001906.1.p1  ORF type:complete len:313 (-),score=54.05 GHVL01001906.1:432-1370(-)
MVAIGPSRNLTSVYTTLRADHKAKQNRWGQSILGGAGFGASPSGADVAGQQSLLRSYQGDGERDIELTTLPPQWVDVVGLVNEQIAQIKIKMSNLQKAQQKKLLRVFESEPTEKTSEIDRICVEISDMFRKVEALIRSMKNKATDNDAELLNNAQKNLATQLQRMSREFRTLQISFVQELKKRQSGSLFAEDNERKSAKLRDQGFTSQQLQELEQIEFDVSQRTEDIDKVASSMTELNNIFKELSTLVIDQGTILDRIDYNVEQVVHRTQEARVHIVKAEKYQNNSRANACLMSLIVGISIMLILVILKWTR